MLRSIVEDVVEGDVEAECLADAIGELNLPEGISAAVDVIEAERRCHLHLGICQRREITSCDE